MAHGRYAGHHTGIIEHEERVAVIQNILNYLNANPDVVAVAGSGISGSSVVSIISHLAPVHPIYVRRDTDKTADPGRIVTSLVPRALLDCRYVILDDLIASGRTVKRIIKHISDSHLFENQTPKAALVYSNPSDYSSMYRKGFYFPAWYMGENDDDVYSDTKWTPERQQKWEAVDVAAPHSPLGYSSL